MKGKNIIFSVIRRFWILFILSILFVNQAYSQRDTTENQIAHSPKKAALLSASFPGLGQIYNKKYWKVPIIYAIEGYFYYRFDYYAGRYNEYASAYADITGGKIEEFENRSNEEDIKKIRNIYRRNRDLYVILMAGVYLANILDASVDAYLFEFDVGENLGMSVHPTAIPTEMSRPVFGFQLSFKF
ncbi:MAG: DUF5683 domain-containing protein [Bacteroidales bacterium]